MSLQGLVLTRTRIANGPSRARLRQVSGRRSPEPAWPGYDRIGPHEAVGIAALVLLAAVTLAWRWVGYQGHDEASYAAAAMDWVANFPALGTTHWALRYPLVLPIAAVIALFGPSVTALTVVNVAAFAGFLIVNYIGARHWLGRGTAMVLTVIGIVLPQFLIQATYANPDLLEMSLAMASFWALMFARERGGSVKLLVASGVLAGLGFLTRETSVMMLVLYGMLFLFRPGMKRARYLWIALGFSVVVGAQIGYCTARSGDPFYRSRISAGHDQVDRSAKAAEADAAHHALDGEGVLATAPLAAPFAAIFISQKYGMLFLLAVPAYVIVRRRRDLTRPQRALIDWCGLGALVGFVFVAANFSILYVVPRYFMVSAAFAAVPLALWFRLWISEGRVKGAVAALAGLGFVTSSVGLLYLENVHPVLAEERIAAFVAASGLPVHVDPETARELHYLLVAGGLLSRLSTEAPQPGDLVATEDGVVQDCLHHPGCTHHEAMQAFTPTRDWVEVARLAPEPRAIETLLQMIGAQSRLPSDLWKKLTRPGTTAVVYQIPANRVPGAVEAANRE